MLRCRRKSVQLSFPTWWLSSHKNHWNHTVTLIFPYPSNDFWHTPQNIDICEKPLSLWRNLGTSLNRNISMCWNTRPLRGALTMFLHKDATWIELGFKQWLCFADIGSKIGFTSLLMIFPAVSHDTLPYNPTVVVGYSWLLYDIMLLSICVSQCYPYYETCG